MFRFLIRRILIALLTLVAIDVITFGVFFAIPSSPGAVMCSKGCTDEKIQMTNRSLGLDKPKVVQFAEFNKGIFVGRDFDNGATVDHCSAPCLGYSFRTQESVTTIMGRALPITVSIVLGAAVLWLVVGVALGIISALRRGTVFDKGAVGLTLLGASMPVYFFALLLLTVFVFTLKLMPYPSFVPFSQNPGNWLLAMILPWASLVAVQAAAYARISRGQMLETLSEDYIRTARAVGLPRRTVIVKHALRAALTPIVTIFGIDLGSFLGGVAITETIFGMHGIGWQAIQAVGTLNLPVVMATVLVGAVFIVVMNTIVDVLYAFIDPRVKLA
jgi:peptide/nickel transport system permease protein